MIMKQKKVYGMITYEFMMNVIGNGERWGEMGRDGE